MARSSSSLHSQTSNLPLGADRATLPEQPIRQIRLVFRWLRWLFLLLALFVFYKVAMIGYHGWRLYQSAQTLRTAVTDPATLQHINSSQYLATVQSAIAQLNGSMSGLEGDLRFAAPMLRQLHAIPKVGAALAEAPQLLLAAKELTAILQEGSNLVSPALVAQKPLLGEDSVASTISNGKSEFALMEQHATVAAAALTQANLAALHPALAENAGLIQILLRALPAFFQIAPTFPTLIGSEKPQTYLILIQNNHELRATGGFITAVGRLTLDKGTIAALDFADSYTVYKQENVYPNAPLAQQKYMAIPIMLFRDGNWSPDLPTSAQTLKAIYFQDTGVAVNGIVTVDINAVQMLVESLGTLKMAGSDQEITGENIVDFLKQLWDRPATSNGTVEEFMKSDWWEKRKDFVPKLAGALLQRIQSGDFNKLDVINAALQSLDRRFVQMWVDDPKAAKAIAGQGWDGSLQPEADADYLALVDSNMGYNKVDSVLVRKLDYQLTWAQGNNAPAQATVTLSYTHPFAVPEEDGCDQTPRYGNSYDAMAARCYFDYVRLYTPNGSKLLASEGFITDTVETLRGEKRTVVFAGYFIMKPGSEHVVRFTYTLPESITVDNYKLLLQKQSGIAAFPIHLNVNGEQFTTDLRDGLFQWELR